MKEIKFRVWNKDEVKIPTEMRKVHFYAGCWWLFKDELNDRLLYEFQDARKIEVVGNIYKENKKERKKDD
ncbi:MAG: hypothetical protein AB1297_03165 [bacterium]